MAHGAKNGSCRRRRQPGLLGAPEGTGQPSTERTHRGIRSGMPERDPGGPFRPRFPGHPPSRRERDRSHETDPGGFSGIEYRDHQRTRRGPCRRERRNIWRNRSISVWWEESRRASSWNFPAGGNTRDTCAAFHSGYPSSRRPRKRPSSTSTASGVRSTMSGRRVST